MAPTRRQTKHKAVFLARPQRAPRRLRPLRPPMNRSKGRSNRKTNNLPFEPTRSEAVNAAAGSKVVTDSAAATIATEAKVDRSPAIAETATAAVDSAVAEGNNVDATAPQQKQFVDNATTSTASAQIDNSAPIQPIVYDAPSSPFVHIESKMAPPATMVIDEPHIAQNALDNVQIDIDSPDIGQEMQLNGKSSEAQPPSTCSPDDAEQQLVAQTANIQSNDDCDINEQFEMADIALDVITTDNNKGVAQYMQDCIKKLSQTVIDELQKVAELLKLNKVKTCWNKLCEAYIRKCAVVHTDRFNLKYLWKMTCTTDIEARLSIATDESEPAECIIMVGIAPNQAENDFGVPPTPKWGPAFIDTGASCSIIDTQLYRQIFGNTNSRLYTKNATFVVNYAGEITEAAGRTRMRVSCAGTSIETTAIVVDGVPSGCVFGMNTLNQLKVKIDLRKVMITRHVGNEKTRIPWLTRQQPKKLVQVCQITAMQIDQPTTSIDKNKQYRVTIVNDVTLEPNTRQLIKVGIEGNKTRVPPYTDRPQVPTHRMRQEARNQYKGRKKRKRSRANPDRRLANSEFHQEWTLADHKAPEGNYAPFALFDPPKALWNKNRAFHWFQQPYTHGGTTNATNTSCGSRQ